MKELNFNRIGKNIRKCRIEHGFTQEYLANRIGVNVSHISNIENDHVKVSLTALVAICNVLNVTVDYILNDEYIQPSALDHEILKELQNYSDEKKEKILQIIKIL